MKFSYKVLSESDVYLLKDLLKVFSEVFEEPQTYQEAIPSEEYLKMILGKETFISIVALNEKKVIGGLASYVLEKFEQERKEVYLYDLAVLKDYRRIGIATALIKKLKEICQELGVYVIFLQADKGDTPAIKLYESFGSSEQVIHFDIPIAIANNKKLKGGKKRK